MYAHAWLSLCLLHHRASKGGKGSAPTTVLSPGITKWLRSCGVDEVCVKGITWDKLLMPNKKGG
jgi:nucleolar MIF4G domain-containing protein 1